MVKKYRTINEVEAEYLRNHPDEVDDYITILFDEYAESGDVASLLSSLQSISRIKGINISDLSHNNAEKFVYLMSLTHSYKTSIKFFKLWAIVLWHKSSLLQQFD